MDSARFAADPVNGFAAGGCVSADNRAESCAIVLARKAAEALA